MSSKIKFGALASGIVGRVPTVAMRPVFSGGSAGGSLRITALSYWNEAKQHYNPSARFGSTDEYQTWNEGPPPFPGWWNAHFNPSWTVALDIWRWWDGVRWSAAYMMMNIPDTVLQEHATEWEQERMRWTDRWPEGARVPRMIPEGYEQFEVLRGICGGVDFPSTQLVLPLEKPDEETVTMRVPVVVADAISFGTLDPAKALQQYLEESDW